MHNTVILTHGWTGSSVLAALLQRAGAWLGDETIVKPDYNTFENAELVRLNKQLIDRHASGLNHEHEFSDSHVMLITERARSADPSELRDFLDCCQQRSPWLWKDPRLTWTIRVWAKFLDLSDIRFVVLTREPTQAWITANLRRHVQSFGFTQAYNGGITRSNARFLDEHGLRYLSLSFEKLLLQPERSIMDLNQLVDSNLELAHLQAVCRLPLGRRSRGLKDFAKAAEIYAKNYSERNGRSRIPDRDTKRGMTAQH